MPLIGMAGSSVMMLQATDALRVATDLGFDAFELLGEFPQCVCDEVVGRSRREMKSLVRDTGVSVAVHAPFTTLNIVAFNAGIRKESVRQCLAAIDLCADIGGGAVIVHSGRYVTSEAFRAKLPASAKVQWELNVQSLREIARRGGARGVMVCLENIGFEAGSMDASVDDLLRIKVEVDSPALAFCIDIGHARLKSELDAVIEKIGPYARHIHFTDNLGEKDDHAVIGEGNLNYTPHLEFFKGFGHIITLEVHNVGTDPGVAIKSRQHLEKLLDLS